MSAAAALDSLTIRNEKYRANSQLDRVTSKFVGLVATHKEFATKRRAVDDNKDFAPSGRAKETQKLGVAAARAVSRAQRFSGEAKAEIAKQRAAMRPKVSDPANIAEAFLRMQARDRLAAMPIADVLKIAHSPTIDRLTTEAIAECADAPWMVSRDFTPELAQRFLDAVIERNHAPQLAAMREANEAVEILDAGVEVVRGDLAKLFNGQPGEFSKWFDGATTNLSIRDMSVEEYSDHINEVADRVMGKAAA